MTVAAAAPARSAHAVPAAPPVTEALYTICPVLAASNVADELGWLDEERAIMESLVGIRRAGADIVITYFAKDAVRLLERGTHRR